MFYFSKKVRLFSQNDVLFLFYFLINLTMTTDNISATYEKGQKKSYFVNSFICYSEQSKQETTKCIDFLLERKNVSKTKF